MAITVIPSRFGKTIVNKVANVSAPTPKLSWPVPTFPTTTNSFLALTLVTVTGSGTSGIQVQSVGTLPGPANSWSLFWISYQGSLPANPTWQEVPIDGLTLNIVLNSVMPSSTFVAYLQQVNAGKTTTYPQETKPIPSDPTQGNITTLQGQIAAMASDLVLSASEKPQAINDYNSLNAEVVALRTQATTIGATLPTANTLLTYLTSLGPIAWNVTPGDTTIPDKTIWQNKWLEPSTEIGALHNNITTKQATQISGTLPITGGTINGNLSVTGSVSAVGGSFTRSSNVASLGATNTIGVGAWFAGKSTAAPDTLSTITNLNGSQILTDQTGQVGLQIGVCSNLGYGSYIQTRWMTSVNPPTDLYLNPSGGNVVIGPGNLSATIQRLGYGTYANCDGLTFAQRNAYGVSFGRTNATDVPVAGQYYNYMLLPEVQGNFSQSVLALNDGVGDSYIGFGHFDVAPTWQKILTSNNVNNNLASILALTGLANVPVACTTVTQPPAVGMNGKYIYIIDNNSYNVNNGGTTAVGSIFKSDGIYWNYQNINPTMIVGTVAASSISAQALATNVALVNNVISSATFTSGGAGGFLGVSGNNTGITSGWAIYDQARPCKQADGTAYNAIAEFGAGVLIGNYPAETLVNRVFFHHQEYLTPGTYYWTAPTGVTTIQAEIVAGGGAGACGRNGTGGGGGGAGAACRIMATVTPGTTYTIVVGSGGATSAQYTPGNPGTYSTLQTDAGTLWVSGGAGGQWSGPGNINTSNGGSGGSMGNSVAGSGGYTGGVGNYSGGPSATAGTSSIGLISWAYGTYYNGAGGGGNNNNGGACDIQLGGTHATTSVYCGGGGGASPYSPGGQGAQFLTAGAGSRGSGGGGGGDSAYGGAGGNGYCKIIW